VRGNVDHLDGRAGGGLGLLDRLFVALAAHLVGVPAVVADELKALVGNVLGDGGDEVTRAENLEVAVNLLVHAGTIDDRVAGRVDLHLFDGERVADDVLGQALQVFALVGLHAAAAVNVEASVHPPAQHPGAVERQ